MPSHNIFFIADGARLEWQSWLLASSLVNAHQGTENVKFFAYCGAEWWPELSDTTKAIFEATGAELRRLPEPPNWAKPYPHGNKIVAATDPRGPGRALFLDTDMVCCKPLTELANLPETHVAAAPEGKPTWGPLERWERAYAHFDLPMPTERVRLLRGKRQEHLPYFNAGLVGFAETEGLAKFGQDWLNTALNFDQSCSIANKRPWLDQITLPLTMARFGYTAHVLGESYNYSLSHRGDYSQTPDAHILHYHRCRFLEQAPQWPRILSEFWETVPAKWHDSARQGLRDLGLGV